jgi:hypothetical protein
LLIPIHLLENSRGEQKFERTAHREALVGAMACTLAAVSVPYGYAQAAAIGLLKLREGRRQAAESGRSGVEKTGKSENTGDGDKTSTTEHDSKQNTAHADCPVTIVIQS